MSTTDALTITSAPDALTKYYDAKEREENAVLYINDAYLEVLNSLEKLEAENAKLRELVDGLEYCVQGLVCDCCPLYDPSGTNHRRCESLERELGVEVDG